jgi:hypothetical protein
MNRNYRYIGCFFNRRSFFPAVAHLRKDPPSQQIRSPHVTFVYAPSEIDRSLFGRTIRVRITGYGNDGQNEGLRAELFSDDPAIAEMIARIEVPHITLAISADGKAVNTKYLEFRDVEPILLTGKFGGYTAQGRVIIRP